MTAKTAILLFTRTPQQEIAHKSFVPQHKGKDLKIATQLIAYTQREAVDTGLPVYTTCGNQQEGNTFGERLANEVEKVFQQGHEQVIIIGNDCPQLTTEWLLSAQQKCDQSQMVIGPAKDGGLYLIALAKNAFDREQFIQLAWESPQLQSTFEDFAQRQAATLLLLPTFQDIDGIAQLQAVATKLSDRHFLKRFLNRILQRSFSKLITAPHTILSPSGFHLSSTGLRAPPSATA